MPVETTTPNLSLILPFRGELSWDTQVNSNFSVLDNAATALAAAGNTLSANSTSGSVSKSIVISGAGIISVAISTSGNTIILSATTPSVTNFSTVSLSAQGNTTSSSNGTFNNLLNVSGAGIISVGVGNGSITISATTPSVTNFSTISLTALGSSTVSNNGTMNNLLNVSGAGIISVGVGNGSITISATTPSVTNFSTVSMSASGNTTLSNSGTFNNVMVFSGAGVASVGVSLNSVTISVPAGAAATVTLTALGNTTSSNNGTFANQLNISGAGIISVGAGNGSITISATTAASANVVSSLNGSVGAMSLSAGDGLSIGQANSTITIAESVLLSFTQNKLIAEVYPILSAVNTITASFNSSLFLNRMFLPRQINLSEVDLAMALSFPATNQGAGTMSQTFILYSFGNSTSLQSFASASSVFAWQTGTVTSGAVVSLSQFQGGWSGSIIHPFTFASTSIPAGDYVVGNQFAFAQGSSTWTFSLFGDLGLAQSTTSIVAATAIVTAAANMVQSVAAVTAALTAFSAAPTQAVVMDTAGLIAASGVTGVSSYASTIIPLGWSSEGAASGLTGFTLQIFSNSSLTIASGVQGVVSLNGSGTVKSSATMWSLIGASSNSNIVSSVGVKAGSIITAINSDSVLSNAGTVGMTHVSAFGSTVSSVVTAAALAALGTTNLTEQLTTNYAFIFQGTGSTQSTMVPFAFINGVASVTNSVTIASIAITNPVVTFIGSNMGVKPWYGLVGA